MPHEQRCSGLYPNHPRSPPSNLPVTGSGQFPKRGTSAKHARQGACGGVALAFAARTLLNIAVVVAADLILGRGGGAMDPAATLFFLTLISVVITLHDRYQSVQARRAPLPPAPPAGPLTRL